MDLDHLYFYDGIAEIVHMMFLGFGGSLIYQYINTNYWLCLIHQLERSIRAIHQLGVLHRDAMPRNMLWNAEASQAMMIDFERAEILEQRTVPGVISPNWKRKMITKTPKKGQGGCDAFAREMQRAIMELRALK